MSTKRLSIGLMLLVLVVSGSPAEPVSAPTLTDLYEGLFRGSRIVHVPNKLFTLKVGATRIFSLRLTSRYPFVWGAYQFKENIQYPRISNDDAFLYYFCVPDLPKSEKESAIIAITYNKRTKEISVVSGGDIDAFARDSLRGYYKNTAASSDGTINLYPDDNAATLPSLAGDAFWYIANPKDLDAGAETLLLMRGVHTESDFPYNQPGTDTEVLAYNLSEKKVSKDISFPFTSRYSTLGFTSSWGMLAAQSTVDQRFVYLVLNPGILDWPTTTIPQTPYRWHVLIYDVRDDVLYSIWHGMDESDKKRALSFSYYLGKDGLYFEVLKEGKIEVYLVDIDLKNAKPLKEYETVDLLWNNKGLKAQWEKKIQEAKAKDPSFEERWE